jgi:CubicO group peptidase (beta-lactamase class C family)
MKFSLFLPALFIASGLFAQIGEGDFKPLDKYIINAVNQFDQPGLAVGIVQNGQLIWSKGYGKLDQAKDAPVTPNSIFFCASLSKAFTACAIGLLVDDGKLDWNDPVREHMPWFNTPEPYRTEHFMVRDLLSHRSGWITFDGDLLWYGTDYSQREILDRHANEPFTHEFRNQFGYSNLMFIAAAQLIESVSGKTWDEFITERILQPLEMNRTTVSTGALSEMTDVAMPHVRKGQDTNVPAKSMPYQSLEGADGATGINSCVNDLAKWDAMWANEGKVGETEFLKEKTWTMITTPHVSFPVSPESAADGKHFDAAALGWFVEDHKGSKVITHSGGMPGFILNHAVVPEKDLAVICLGNGESYSVFAITEKILEMYLGDENADPVSQILPRIKAKNERDAARRKLRADSRVKNTKPSYPSNEYVGTYTDKIYGNALITEQGGNMVLTLEPAKGLFTGALEHWHFDTFKWNHADPFLESGYVTFYFNTDHKIMGFKIDQHSPDFHFYKFDFVKQ